MTKIYEVSLDCGVLGEFTCDAHCLMFSNGDLGSITKVMMPMGKFEINVYEFLSDVALENVELQIANAISEGSLEWKDLSR